jgi:hypothetical protein
MIMRRDDKTAGSHESRCVLYCARTRELGQAYDEDRLLPSQLLRRMREPDEAALQPGAALFLRRVRGADGPPELFQIRRGAAALRDSGRLRAERNAPSEPERAVAKHSVKRRLSDSGGVGARYFDGVEPRAEIRNRRARHVRRQNEEGDSLQTSCSAGTAVPPAPRTAVHAGKNGKWKMIWFLTTTVVSPKMSRG